MRVLFATLVATALCLSSISPAQAGLVDGPTKLVQIVNPNSTWTLRGKYEKEANASVYVNGDGSTDVDCFVYDSSGGLIDSDTNPLDTCYLTWRPAWTGYFKIVIKNTGAEENKVKFSSN
jgi:hypothetical protein